MANFSVSRECSAMSDLTLRRAAATPPLSEASSSSAALSLKHSARKTATDGKKAGVSVRA